MSQEYEVVSVKTRTCAEPGRPCYSEGCEKEGRELKVGDLYARVLWEDGLVELFHADCYALEFGQPLRRTSYTVAQLEAMLAQAKAAAARRHARTGGSV